MAVAEFLHFVADCGTGLFILLWTTQSSNWIGKSTRAKSKKSYSRSLPAATRGVWDCSMGANCPPGQLKEKELPGSCTCPSVCSRKLVQAEHLCVRKICYANVPVIPSWVICSREFAACLFKSGKSLLQEGVNSLIADSRSWHFLIIVCSCSPYSIVHTPSKMLIPFPLERGNIFDAYDDINKLAFDYINKSLTLWEVFWLLFERS